jgi:hypothetical protein
MAGKYVVLKKGDELVAVLLPPLAEHRAALYMFGTTTSDVVSAGLFEVRANGEETLEVECYGGTVDVGAHAGVCSRGDVDAALLRAQFRG